MTALNVAASHVVLTRRDELVRSAADGENDRVQLDLGESHWASVKHGELTGPDGARYLRRTTRIKRRDADELVMTGTPVVVYYWADGRLSWHDGPDAVETWRENRSHLTSSEPRPSRKHVVWTVGSWDDGDDRAVLVLTGHC